MSHSRSIHVNSCTRYVTVSAGASDIVGLSVRGIMGLEIGGYSKHCIPAQVACIVLYSAAVPVVVQCCAMLCCAVLCCAVLCCAVLYFAVLPCPVMCCAVPCYTTVVLYGTGTVLCGAVPCYTINSTVPSKEL